jgi:hypothetical protein
MHPNRLRLVVLAPFVETDAQKPRSHVSFGAAPARVRGYLAARVTQPAAGGAFERFRIRLLVDGDLVSEATGLPRGTSQRMFGGWYRCVAFDFALPTPVAGRLTLVGQTTDDEVRLELDVLASAA